MEKTRRAATRSTTVRHATVQHAAALGFGVWRNVVAAPMEQAHSHSDIELNCVLNGSAKYFLGGRFQTLEARTTGVFWAAMPHQLVHFEARTEMVWVTLPLAWFLQWRLDESLCEPILHGALIQRSAGGEHADAPTFERWAHDMKNPHDETRRIVLLEVEAWLRRLALSLRHDETLERNTSRRGGTARDASGGQVEVLAAYLARHYQEPLTAAQIARAVGLHPNYAALIFKRGCGMSLWDYLTQLRVSHAQRLLLTTDLKLNHIARDAGFSSMSRFHDAFARVTGHTPRGYRQCGMRNAEKASAK